MTSVTVAGPEDAPALAAIHALAFDHPWTAPDIAALLEAPGAVAARAGSLGMVIARVAAGEMEVLTLAVAPAARRRGLARALMAAVLEAAVRHGAVEAFLEVATDNAAALALYGRLGFERRGLRRGYYARKDSPAADAVVMRLDLAGLSP